MEVELALYAVGLYAFVTSEVVLDQEVHLLAPGGVAGRNRLRITADELTQAQAA